MLFNSYIFLVFALVFFALWPLMRKRKRVRWIFLTTASFFFYGWWDWRFLFLIIGSGLLDYFTGLGMERFPARKRILLLVSLVGNIGSLGVFKYSGFIAGNVDIVLAWVGIPFQLSTHIPEFALILPVGISFYTFQSMSYTIDIYRNQLKPTHSIFHFFPIFPFSPS